MVAVCRLGEFLRPTATAGATQGSDADAGAGSPIHRPCRCRGSRSCVSPPTAVTRGCRPRDSRGAPLLAVSGRTQDWPARRCDQAWPTIGAGRGNRGRADGRSRPTFGTLPTGPGQADGRVEADRRGPGVDRGHDAGFPPAYCQGRCNATLGGGRQRGITDPPAQVVTRNPLVRITTSGSRAGGIVGATIWSTAPGCGSHEPGPPAERDRPPRERDQAGT